MGIIILVSLGNSCATAAPVSLENNWASATWEQLCQSHLGTILPVSLKNNRFSLTWKQLHQCHATWEQLCQYHLGIIVPPSNNIIPDSTTERLLSVASSFFFITTLQTLKISIDSEKAPLSTLGNNLRLLN